jgi:hypothetical protein
MDRRVMWLFVTFGSTVGGLIPEAWGGSAFGLTSLFFACLGGVAGVWAASRLAS